MGTTLWRAIGAGLFSLVIILSGHWLSISGKPYSAILLNVHKLIALAAVVFLIITVVQISRTARLSATEIVGTVVTGLFCLGLFVTGGLLSVDKPMPLVVLRLHEITPYLAVLSAGITLYLLLSRR